MASRASLGGARRLCSLAADAYNAWPRGGGLVHAAASVHASATVEPCAVVLRGATVGADVTVGATSVVGDGVHVRERTRLGYGVRLSNCTIGSDCILHHGVCVGADGFGFEADAAGRLSKRPQLLRALVHDHVEIGANSCVDRGSWRDTVIGAHTKLDNLVQVGHNAHIGEHCLLCAHAAVGGSSSLGDHVVMGGKSAVRDHVSVTSRVRIAAKAGVSANITESGDYAGFPAEPAARWRRQVVTLRRLGRRRAGAGDDGMPD
ncbi:trimeric LpxA-like protein [Pavlovales sp. CCMP2436]|nr:trimeric LpxA-like protein [Pavlovales sp. CCMP2436]|mmetsp:Transcript_17209/g.44093  ORF Transcript_17209/g.44093 Transcript_17209/m.44093 type:complete len:262 (+) Transcript_17209:2-787(+)